MTAVDILTVRLNAVSFDTSIDDPTQRYAKNLVDWFNNEEKPLASVVSQLTCYADLVSGPEAPPKIHRKICCDLIDQMRPELPNDFSALKILYQVHKQSVANPETLDQKSPKWSEQLQGPELKLFLKILRAGKLAQNILDVFITSYVSDDCTAQGRALALRVFPSLRSRELISKVVERSLHYPDVIRAFPDKLRCRVFTKLLQHNSASAILLAARIADKVYLTTVTRMLTQINRVSAEPEAQQALKCLFKAKWYEDPNADKAQYNGLLENVSEVAIKCGLTKYPKSRWSSKIAKISRVRSGVKMKSEIVLKRSGALPKTMSAIQTWKV